MEPSLDCSDAPHISVPFDGLDIRERGSPPRDVRPGGESRGVMNCGGVRRWRLEVGGLGDDRGCLDEARQACWLTGPRADVEACRAFGVGAGLVGVSAGAEVGRSSGPTGAHSTGRTFPSPDRRTSSFSL